MNKKDLLSLISFALFCIGMIFPQTVNAQISEGGTPLSFASQNRLKSDLPAVQIPIQFSVEDLKIVDAWQVSQGAPLKLATLIETDLGIGNSGNQITLPDGKSIWQLRIQAKGAIALMLYYDAFYIPEGGRLFIYNADKTQVIGAFTNQTNPASPGYATEFIAGDDLVLEYESAAGSNTPRIHISEIGYGYNHLSVSRKTATRAEDISGACMVDINCEEGDAWQKEKRGVCQLIEKIGKGTYLCSGSLINNTKEDMTPYILSAFHCTEDQFGKATTKDEYNKWLFYFHYENTGCNNAFPNIAYKTIVGSTKVAASPIDGGSDGLLLRLNQQIPENYDVYYNGWDRSNTAAQSGVGIHHPGGDYMKISTFNSPVKDATWYGEDKSQGYRNAHWNVIFEATANGHAITEGGSSGSPLFNQSELVVGTLSGGNSSCKPDELDGINLYGKLYNHWDKYSKADTARMDKYLDPLNTGATLLEGRYATGRKPAPSNLIASYQNNAVNMSWKAPSSTTGLSKYIIYKNNTQIGESQQTSFADTDPETGTALYRVSALYTDKKESSATHGYVLVPEYKAPTNVTAIADQSNNVTVNWKKPVYYKSLYWGSNEAAFNISFGIDNMYFGQLWEATDLTSLHKKTIRAVQFLPLSGASYSIFIMQGNIKYEQKVNNAMYDNINLIQLKTPFVIDNTEDLIATIHVSDIGKDVYPIVCDNGPAVNKKGNILSEDGIKWEYYNDPSDDPEQYFDSNFYLSILVSSEEGVLTKARSSSSYTNQAIGKSSIKAVSTRKTNVSAVSLRSEEATAFLEPTGYNIYRNSLKQGEIRDKTVLEYMDKNVLPAHYTYQVSAVYGNEESEKSEASKEVSVDNESIPIPEITIMPTSFGQQVRLNGNERVALLEVVSADGKLLISKKHPEATIHTESLPAGIYFFRIHTDNEVKVIKGIKQ